MSGFDMKHSQYYPDTALHKSNVRVWLLMDWGERLFPIFRSFFWIFLFKDLFLMSLEKVSGNPEAWGFGKSGCKQFFLITINKMTSLS